MSYRGHDPNIVNAEASGTLGFLKTVVSDSSDLQRNESDSDKENDRRLMTISEESTETKSVLENPKEQVQDRFSQAKGESDLVHLDGSDMAHDKENKMWEEFYNEEDFTVKEAGPVIPTMNGTLEMNGFTTRFDVDNNRILDKVEEECEVTDERSQGDDYSSIFESSVKDDEVDVVKEDTSSGPNEKKKRKTKKLFKRRHPPTIVTTSQSTGGSHPDLGRPDKHNHNHQLETMSESGGSVDKGRRLSRRKQVSRPRCAGPSPNGDVLQQKYQELEQLVLKPLPNPATYVKQTRQQMLRLQGMGNQYHASNHTTSSSQTVEGLPPPSANTKQNQVIVEEVSDEGYSTIRTIQVVQGATNSSTTARHNRPQTAHPSRRPRSGNRQVRPASAGRARPLSAANNQDTVNTNPFGNRGRGVQKHKAQGRKNVSGTGRGGQRSDSESKDRSSHDSPDSRDPSSDNPSRSNSRSPNRIITHTETHLKYSSNPDLQQWLKKKNKQHRQQKQEERKQKRAERTEKQEIERKRQESFKDSDKRVKEWMVKKRKDAWKKAKEEKRKENEEEMERFDRQQQSQYSGSLMGHSIQRPQSAPAHSDRKMFIPVIRPDGDQFTSNIAVEQSNGDAPMPQPPKSKFVYKRPVSGRVRLMKLQQERREDSKKQEKKKKEEEKLTEEEKNQKMRMSYDQWLLKKRQEDYEKRQLGAKQRALAKSDPELERVVPEAARRRIENIQRGKRRIQTNVNSIDEDVNKSFGGGDFGEGETGHIQEAPGLKVSGQKKSLGQRPSSAKAHSSNGPLNPQMSKSPRRPKSAHPRVQKIMDSSEEERVVDAKTFQLPFPPELGVPKYVAERQEKLFSPDVTAKASLHSELQKGLVGAQQSKLEETAINGDSRQVKESEITEPDISSADDKDEKHGVTENEGVEDEESSFFVTDSKIVHIEKQEFVSCAEIEAFAFDDCEYIEEDDLTQEGQGNPESNEVNDQLERVEGDAAAETEIKSNEVEEDKEEQKINDAVEEMDNVAGEDLEEKENEVDMTTEYNCIEQKLEEPIEMIAEIDMTVQEQLEEVLLEEQTETKPELMMKIQTETEESQRFQTSLECQEQKQKNENKEQTEDEEPKSEVSESKSSTKHVSFLEEAVIHVDPLAGIPAADYVDTDDDEAEDERGDFFGEDSPRNEKNFWNNARDEIDQGDDEDYF